MFRQTDLIAIFGRRGSGKSTLCKTIQRAFPRVVVIDLLHEYPDSQADHVATTFEGFGRICAHLADTKPKKFRVIFRFDVEKDENPEEINQVLRVLYHLGNCVIVIEEIHHYMRREVMPPWLKKIVLLGRHRGLGILATSQRPAEVSKTFVSQCHHVFAGVFFERNDLAYFADTIGSASQLLEKVKPFRFIHFEPGKPVKIVKNQ